MNILFITAISCSMLNCIMGIINGNWLAAAGWFMAAFAGFLIWMDDLELKQ